MQSRRSDLFQILINDPDNLDAAFEYALLSVEVGDLEGAIGRLERMLIYVPGLPRVQLELAVLYYRIGAFDEARRYLDLVQQANLPPAVRARVEDFSAQLDQARRPFRVSGSVHVGAQYHTDANLAPNQESVII